MSRESDFKTRMEADTTLMATLTGGVFTSASVGRDGITRTSAAAAFDSSGYLKPCALVKQRGLIPDLVVNDQEAGVASATQVVEIWLYQDSGYDSIDTALNRLFVLFHGHSFTDSFPVEWLGTLDREVDEGALNGASMARQEYLVAEIAGD